jgi:hypothetical protein
MRALGRLLAGRSGAALLRPALARPRVAPGLRSLSSSSTDPAAAAAKPEDPPRPPAEEAVGSSQRLEFQAETKKLLDIVANSLYTDKEVFLRELISNASDALEKRRYAETTGAAESDAGEMRIAISTDAEAGTLTIADTGIGMSREDLVANLGTIASSGSKRFVQQLQSTGGDGASAASSNVIGQFGVGFYSVFMVADQVTVYTRQNGSEVGYCWKSTGDGDYELGEAANVAAGTKVRALRAFVCLCVCVYVCKGKERKEKGRGRERDSNDGSVAGTAGKAQAMGTMGWGRLSTCQRGRR